MQFIHLSARVTIIFKNNSKNVSKLRFFYGHKKKSRKIDPSIKNLTSVFANGLNHTRKLTKKRLI